MLWLFAFCLDVQVDGVLVIFQKTVELDGRETFDEFLSRHVVQSRKDFGHERIDVFFVYSHILHACDEVHQLFVNGRSCQLYDVLIDSFGVIIGILTMLLFVKKRDL
ncbi:MAG: VanZ family protein [Paludibacteraceae bacterium]|nr:VanZ family protein [Paludibacteraceae bacterium]